MCLTYTYTCTYTYIHIYLYIDIHRYTRIIDISISDAPSVYVYMHVYIYTHTNTRAYTHIHTQTYASYALRKRRIVSVYLIRTCIYVNVNKYACNSVLGIDFKILQNIVSFMRLFCKRDLQFAALFWYRV